jgi:hypothetical protein
MALVVGENTYASLSDIQDWLDDRGYSVTATEAAVLRAMDYIESLPWADEREDEDSDLWWGDDPPDAVVNALCQATRLEVDTPYTLMTDSEQRVKREKVDVIEVEYESGGMKTMHPIITRYLGSLLQAGNVFSLRLN